MSTVNDAIISSLNTSKLMLQRFTEDLKPEEYLHRPIPKCNCAAWIIGHLAVSNRQVMQAMGAKDLPPLPEGFEQRFARNETAAQAQDFGDVTTLVPTFVRTSDALAAAVKAAPLELLDKPVEKPLPMFRTHGEMVLFISLHTAMHLGQITTIRRSLGRPPLV